MAETAPEPGPSEAEAPSVAPEDRPEDAFDDVAGTGEENFEDGMRQNAMEMQAIDKDNDHKLDFGEFCALVRERELGDHTDEELEERFKALDADGSGKIDMNEYVLFTLRDSLARSSTRVIELFKQWDDDNSGTVGKAEFRRAVQAMGFSLLATPEEIGTRDRFEPVPPPTRTVPVKRRPRWPLALRK